MPIQPRPWMTTWVMFKQGSQDYKISRLDPYCTRTGKSQRKDRVLHHSKQWVVSSQAQFSALVSTAGPWNPAEDQPYPLWSQAPPRSKIATVRVF